MSFPVKRSLRDRKQKLVLVVDDTKTLRLMAREALEDIGVAVAEAADGREGVRAVSELEPDLVLLDVQMPKLDGFGACEEIRRSSGGVDIPVVMMTSLDDLPSIRRAYEAGATDFVTKPVEWVIVAQRIRYMLRMGELLTHLRASEERLAKAQRIASLGVWEYDLEAGTVAFSDQLRRLYGLRSDATEAGFDELLNLVHPDDREITRTAISRCLEEATALSVDHRLPLRQGAERCIHLQADVVYDDLGRASGLSGTAQDVTQRKEAEREIRFLAYHDPLTGLANRRLFMEQLDHALAQARRHGTLVAVLYLDLDLFKRINDMLGHAAGDGCLRSMAERLRHCVRECDLVSRALDDIGDAAISRFGGDEFLISLSSVGSVEEVRSVAERILDALRSSLEVEGHEVVVTGSIGIALSGLDGDDVDTLLRNADTAMYRAKQENRGTYRFYEPAMNAVFEENLKLESDLRAAIQNDQIDLHYQPKIEVASGRITGFEALARWNHPERGMVPPDRFIPVAEAGGLMIQLGERVLRKACLQAKQWHEMRLPPVRISVNVSAHQFATDAVGEMVQAVLRETPVSPRQLDIEITESAMMHNKEVTQEVLRILKGVGITVAIDDFGTGYSSLSYLKGFPVDTIKIDREFIRDVTTDPGDAALTAAIISMAKALSLRIVAEGVETEEQLAFLKERGCDEAQGYFFSKPLPADAATEFLRAHGGAEDPPEAAG